MRTVRKYKIGVLVDYFNREEVSKMNDMTIWIAENTDGYRSVDKRDNAYLYATFAFKDAEDATAFKLKFGI